jgi:hypothetical protein
MFFQLWSHTHLYKDIDIKSTIFASQGESTSSHSRPMQHTGSQADLEKFAIDKHIQMPCPFSVQLVSPYRPQYSRSASSSEISLTIQDSCVCSENRISPASSVSFPSKVVRGGGTPIKREDLYNVSNIGISSNASTSSLLRGKHVQVGEVQPEEASGIVALVVQTDCECGPLLSWPITILLLLSVTVVSDYS